MLLMSFLNYLSYSMEDDSSQNTSMLNDFSWISSMGGDSPWITIVHHLMSSELVLRIASKPSCELVCEIKSLTEKQTLRHFWGDISTAFLERTSKALRCSRVGKKGKNPLSLPSHKTSPEFALMFGPDRLHVTRRDELIVPYVCLLGLSWLVWIRLRQYAACEQCSCNFAVQPLYPLA